MGQRTTIHLPARETCLLILTGTAGVTAGGSDLGTLGGRRSVFDDIAPGGIYLPAATPCTVVAQDNASWLFARHRAASRSGTHPQAGMHGRRNAWSGH